MGEPVGERRIALERGLRAEREAAERGRRSWRARGAARRRATTSTGSPVATSAASGAGDAAPRAVARAPAAAAAPARVERPRDGPRGEVARELGARTPSTAVAGSPTSVDRRRRGAAPAGAGRGAARRLPFHWLTLERGRWRRRGSSGARRAARAASRTRPRAQRHAAGARRVKRDVAALRPSRAGRRAARPGRAARRRVALPNGASRSSSSASARPSRRPATTASTRSRGTRSSGRSTAAACATNAARKRVDASRRDRQAGRGAMAAVAQQVPRAGVQAAEQVEAPGSSGPSRCPRSPVERDQHRRAVVALGDPRGDDADHARMPALAGEHVRRRLGRARRPAPRPRSGSASRRRAARRSPCRAPRRLRRARSASSVSSSSSPASARCSRPAALIRGASRKPIARASTRARVDTARRAISARRPGLRVSRERAQPGAHEPAVLAEQRHDVGDGGQGDQVEVLVGQRRVLARASQQRLRQLVGDAAPRTGPRTGSRRARGCTIGASGSAPSARGVWWSVTTTSMPGRAGGARPRRRR